jgi:hypothetical protein
MVGFEDFGANCSLFVPTNGKIITVEATWCGFVKGGRGYSSVIRRCGTLSLARLQAHLPQFIA